MSCCNCGQPKKLCRCPQKGEAPKRAYIAECTDCDPCRPCESMVKICSFVAPTLTEGQRFRNSFVYNQEDDSVYYIDDSGTPTRFGSSPMFIDNFNPDDRAIPRQTVFDFANNKAYIYDPEGNYITVGLSGTSGAPTRVTLVYPTDQSGEWVIDNITINLNYTAGQGGDRIATAVVPITSITGDDKNYTLEEIFQILDGGGDVMFDNVPLCFTYDGESSSIGVIGFSFSGLKVNARSEYQYNGDDVVEWSGIVSGGDLPMGFGIRKIISNGDTRFVFFAQGIYHSEPFN